MNYVFAVVIADTDYWRSRLLAILRSQVNVSIGSCLQMDGVSRMSRAVACSVCMNMNESLKLITDKQLHHPPGYRSLPKPSHTWSYPIISSSITTLASKDASKLRHKLKQSKTVMCRFRFQLRKFRKMTLNRPL